MPDMTDFAPSPCRDMMPGNEVLPLTGQTHILAGNKKRDYMGRIIIMGATSGIGMEVAKLFIADSWTVGVAGRRGEPLMRLAALAPGRVLTRQIDVTDEHAATLLMELVEECGGMDVYLHSSGIGYNNPALRPDDELRTVETNGVGFVRMTGAAFNYFAARGSGHVAAITSIAGTKGLGAAPAYSATKRMQSTYLSALKQQAAMRGARIAVTDIRPGFVRTGLLGGARYPMQMDAKDVARSIHHAIMSRRRVAVIDWRYAILVALWRLIPRPLWERWKINVK